MIDFISNFFNKEKPDIEFVDTLRLSYTKAPIRLAKDEPVFFADAQKEQFKKYSFPFCPGMDDLSKYGYILPAWHDFHLKSNKAGHLAFIGGNKRGHGFAEPVPMEKEVVTGIFELQDGITLNPWKFDSPWGIFVNKEISCFLMPAFFHSTFLDDVYVYPGIVDYSKGFKTINFICALKRDAEVKIKCGEPLLHILPFHNKTIKAEFGPASPRQLDQFKSQIHNSQKQFYRKNLMVKKRFDLKEQQEND